MLNDIFLTHKMKIILIVYVIFFLAEILRAIFTLNFSTSAQGNFFKMVIKKHGLVWSAFALFHQICITPAPKSVFVASREFKIRKLKKKNSNNIADLKNQ